MNQIWFGTIAIVLLAIELKIGSGSGSGRPYGEISEQRQAEEVKKLLTMHREKMKPAMDKLIEEQQKDVPLQSMLKKLNECRAKHSNESRTQTPSILELNEKSKFAGALWQGDIFLSPSQVQLLFGDVGRFKRGAGIRNVLRQWPMNIKYSFDESINNELKGRIQRALNFWNEKSCLNLTEDNSDGTISRIHFTSADNGCYSRIGMLRVDFTQSINLGPGCESDGIIHHQLAHTLGLWHEHSRLDRDRHFWIYARNANSSSVDQFDRQTPGTLIDWDIGYNLGSVTHFGANAFSKDGIILQFLWSTTFAKLPGCT
uniref:Metalloendopeptidase n=1 Tax=Globodera pallida TaxID=36090 RepID=A0A183BN63_GLOPA